MKILGLILISFYVFILGRSGVPQIEISTEDSKQSVNSVFVKHLNLGLSRLISSTTWVKTLLDGDIVQLKDGSKNSWMFYRFLLISELEPAFYNNYYIGGRYLSIIKNDLAGAEIIYDRGVERFPDSFWLIYHAAFNQYHEMGNYHKAVKLYRKILNKPEVQKYAPFLPSLVARVIATSTGDLESSFNLLYGAYVTMGDDVLKQRTAESLYSIKAEIDLGCLNFKKTNCKDEDFEGHKYILKNGTYISARPYQKFKLFKNKK